MTKVRYGVLGSRTIWVIRWSIEYCITSIAISTVQRETRNAHRIRINTTTLFTHQRPKGFIFSKLSVRSPSP
jgi:hypothetical protein